MSPTMPVLPRPWPYSMAPQAGGGWSVTTANGAPVCISEGDGLASWLCQYTHLLARACPDLPEHQPHTSTTILPTPLLPRPWPFLYERTPRGDWVVSTSDGDAVCFTPHEGLAVWLCKYTLLLAESAQGIEDGQGVWW